MGCATHAYLPLASVRVQPYGRTCSFLYLHTQHGLNMPRTMDNRAGGYITGLVRQAFCILFLLFAFRFVCPIGKEVVEWALHQISIQGMHGRSLPSPSSLHLTFLPSPHLPPFTFPPSPSPFTFPPSPSSLHLPPCLSILSSQAMPLAVQGRCERKICKFKVRMG